MVATDGGNGVAVWTRDGSSIRLEPPAGKVVDTVGGGDSFQSALLARLAKLGPQLLPLTGGR